LILLFMKRYQDTLNIPIHDRLLSASSKIGLQSNFPDTDMFVSNIYTYVIIILIQACRDIWLLTIGKKLNCYYYILITKITITINTLDWIISAIVDKNNNIVKVYETYMYWYECHEYAKIKE